MEVVSREECLDVREDYVAMGSLSLEGLNAGSGESRRVQHDQGIGRSRFSQRMGKHQDACKIRGSGDEGSPGIGPQGPVHDGKCSR